MYVFTSAFSSSTFNIHIPPAAHVLLVLETSPFNSMNELSLLSSFLCFSFLSYISSQFRFTVVFLLTSFVRLVDFKLVQHILQ